MGPYSSSSNLADFGYFRFTLLYSSTDQKVSKNVFMSNLEEVKAHTAVKHTISDPDKKTFVMHSRPSG